eukprot:TRINITY_DN88168_c3_g1_i1.p1 TRINITY_DN88168_c3_g1~~TRINITY_DN88168_c3_g1_i1.p1  ORF type:complete len:441 (+),score=28.75 TRINITY_DN88168_c3_g1_i1:113-1324(+)
MGSACQGCDRKKKDSSEIPLRTLSLLQKSRSQYDSPCSKHIDFQSQAESFCGGSSHYKVDGSVANTTKSSKISPFRPEFGKEEEGIAEWVGVFSKDLAYRPAYNESEDNVTDGVYMQFMCGNVAALKEKNSFKQKNEANDFEKVEEEGVEENESEGHADQEEQEKVLKRTITPCFLPNSDSKRRLKTKQTVKDEDEDFSSHFGTTQQCPDTKDEYEVTVPLFASRSPVSQRKNLSQFAPQPDPEDNANKGRICHMEKVQQQSDKCSEKTRESPVRRTETACFTLQSEKAKKKVIENAGEETEESKSHLGTSRIQGHRNSHYKAVVCKNVLKTLERPQTATNPRIPIKDANCPSSSDSSRGSREAKERRENGASLFLNVKDNISQLNPNWGILYSLNFVRREHH